MEERKQIEGMRGREGDLQFLNGNRYFKLLI
jgi:hypothetical protein